MSDIYADKYKDNPNVVDMMDVPVVCFDFKKRKVDYYADHIINKARVYVITSNTYFLENEKEFLDLLDEKKHVVLYRVFYNGKTDESITAKFATLEN